MKTWNNLNFWDIVIAYLILINLTAFIVAAVDKSKAKRGLWRIPERSLFLLGILGGCPGLYAGFLFFRHKTKHAKFMVGIPLIFILQAVGAYLLYHFH